MKLLSMLVRGIKELFIPHWPLFLLMIFTSCLENVFIAFASPACVDYHPGGVFFTKNVLLILPVQIFIVSLVISFGGYLCATLSCFLSLVYIVFIGVTSFLFFTQNSLIKPQYIQIILDTNSKEIIEWFQEWPLSMGCTTVLTLTITAFLAYHYYTHRKTKQFGRFALVGVSIIPLVFLAYFSYSRFGDLRQFYLLPKAFYSIYEWKRSNQLVKVIASKSIPDEVKCNKSAMIGVVVIGESASRNHFGCYGYSRATTPFMSNREWCLFSDVITALPATHIALKYAFSDASLEGHTPTTTMPLLFNALPESTSHYISKQYVKGYDTIGMLFGNCDDIQLLDETQGHDEIVVKSFKETLEKSDLSARHLYFLHLIGSHTPFHKRYPPEKQIFGDKDLFDTYDNSIHYTDSILEEARSFVDNVTAPVFLLYFSDHGESPGNGVRTYSDYNSWEIPFGFYFNAEFRRIFPDIVNAIDKSKNLPLQLDCLFEMLCWIYGITYDGMFEERIPFMGNYKPHDRIVQQISDRHPSHP